MDIIRRGSELAMRFPRFTASYRLDKAAEDAATTTEIVEMYQEAIKEDQ